ncbi:MAG: RrF2 family transcriptional regulator [Bacteroidota bacterium]
MFNKETEYALRGLVYIRLQNRFGRRPGIVEISREIDAPQQFTAKILQRLVRNGFIASAKGKGGGFYFEEEGEDLPVRKVVHAIEGDKLFTGCAFGLKNCDENNPCPLHNRYAPIREAMNDLVSTETVQSLASRYHSSRFTLYPEKDIPATE